MRSLAFAAMLLLAAPDGHAACGDAPAAGIDWSGCTKHNLHVRKRNLQGARFEHATLVGLDFERSNLSGARFVAADVSRTSFQDAVLERANLGKLIAVRSSFAGARLAGADLEKAELHRCVLTGADLRRANLSKGDFGRSVFEHAGEQAIVYAPREYRTKVISVSNVPFKEMGTGSLCDYSLWARGSTDEDFGYVVQRAITLRPRDLILVSHAYLGGTKIRWWRIYEAALARREVAWRGFDDWLRATRPVAAANADIPVNREVRYVAPKPAVPLEQLEDIPGVRRAAAPADALGVCQ